MLIAIRSKFMHKRVFKNPQAFTIIFSAHYARAREIFKFGVLPCRQI